MDNKKTTYNAIMFFPAFEQKRTRKYRNIANLPNFLKFALKEGAWYINLYNAKSGKFECRKYVTGAL